MKKLITSPAKRLKAQTAGNDLILEKTIENIQSLYQEKEGLRQLKREILTCGFLSLLTSSLKTLVESGKAVAWRARKIGNADR